MADYPPSALTLPPEWSPDQEKQFQTFMAFDPSVRQWKNSFTSALGGPPAGPDDPGGDYNYRYAYAAGEHPQPYAYDTVPHWGSAGKTAGHPTAWMNDFMQQFGVDPNALQGQQVTPQIQQFMQSLIGQAPFSLAPMMGGR